LPDPVDPDPFRYAALAVLIHLICGAFHRHIDLGLLRDSLAIVEDFEALQARPKVHDRPPQWVQRVPSLPQRVFIPDAEGNVLKEDDPNVSEEFKVMNIIAQVPHIHFV
jgi:hypothetical protein